MKAKTKIEPFRHAHIPEAPTAKSLKFDNEMMHVFLSDGRILSVPLIFFPLLHKATPKQRKKFEIDDDGSSIHWPELDEDLSVSILVTGRCLSP